LVREAEVTALRNLRQLRIMVLHPPDPEGEELLRHLRRIGARVDAGWPPPAELPPQVDVVFLDVGPGIAGDLRAGWTGEGSHAGPTLIAIVDYENPTVLQAVIDLEVQAVLSKPIRPFGVLTSLILAREIWLREGRLQDRIRKLERKVAGVRKLSQAKQVLMSLHKVPEEEAYRIIRDQAMAKRVSTEEIATAILTANDVLNLRRSSG
jgi:AmiR/NasT family two-component response regulator